LALSIAGAQPRALRGRARQHAGDLRARVIERDAEPRRRVVHDRRLAVQVRRGEQGVGDGLVERRIEVDRLLDVERRDRAPGEPVARDPVAFDDATQEVRLRVDPDRFGPAERGGGRDAHAGMAVERHVIEHARAGERARIEAVQVVGQEQRRHELGRAV
jgi:hypothetical protein